MNGKMYVIKWDGASKKGNLVEKSGEFYLANHNTNNSEVPT